MVEVLEFSDFLKLPGVVFDVRSPGEFDHGRIPGAISLPLFSNQERALVGTTYKQAGKENAVLQGLQLVGPKLAAIVGQAKIHMLTGFAKVHCWRGGMRSSSVAWLLETAGMKTATLNGGYKAFRRWALNEISLPKTLIIIGGMTGCGKTSILRALKAKGEQVLDLESLANHRGSSYGMIGMPPQPSSEQFENEIAIQLASFDPKRPVWIEDESRFVGTCKIPDTIFSQMLESPLCMVERPLNERKFNLQLDYGNASPLELKEATQRIAKRLGGARTKEVIELIDTGHWAEAAEIVLKYYDSAYQHALSRRKQPQHQIKGDNMDENQWAELLLERIRDKGR